MYVFIYSLSSFFFLTSKSFTWYLLSSSVTSFPHLEPGSNKKFCKKFLKCNQTKECENKSCALKAGVAVRDGRFFVVGFCWLFPNLKGAP